MAGTAKLVFSYLLLACFIGAKLAKCADPDPLQDFCIGLPHSAPLVNGMACKPDTTSEDFVSHVLKQPGNVQNKLGSSITEASALAFPGLNTQGLSFARFDYAKEGIIVPHVHPRATELMYVIEGTLLAGFVTSENKLFLQTIYKGDVFLFPRGLIHFHLNVGESEAQALAAFNSQNPGTTFLPNALFYSDPPISDIVMAKSFGLNPDLVEKIRYAVKGIFQ